MIKFLNYAITKILVIYILYIWLLAYLKLIVITKKYKIVKSRKILFIYLILYIIKEITYPIQWPWFWKLSILTLD